MLVSKMLGATMVAGAAPAGERTRPAAPAPYGSAIPCEPAGSRAQRPPLAPVRIRRRRGSLFRWSAAR